MPERTELEKLSNREIKELRKQTTDRARISQAQQGENAVNEQTLEDGYHKDAFGNLIEGPPPKRKDNRYFVNAEEYVVELAEGQEPPKSSGSGLVDWLNKVDVANDPEVREALGERALYFEHEVAGGDASFLLVGSLGKNGWNVSVRSNSERHRRF